MDQVKVRNHMSASQKYRSDQRKKSCRSVRNIDQVKVRNHMSVSQKYSFVSTKKDTQIK